MCSRTNPPLINNWEFLNFFRADDDWGHGHHTSVPTEQQTTENKRRIQAEETFLRRHTQE